MAFKSVCFTFHHDTWVNHTHVLQHSGLDLAGFCWACLLRNQACVGSRVLFRRATHVLKVSVCLRTLQLPAKMANAWAEFSSEQAVLKDFFSTYQPARYLTCYWDVVLLQIFSTKEKKPVLVLVMIWVTWGQKFACNGYEGISALDFYLLKRAFILLLVC